MKRNVKKLGLFCTRGLEGCSITSNKCVILVWHYELLLQLLISINPHSPQYTVRVKGFRSYQLLPTYRDLEYAQPGVELL